MSAVGVIALGTFREAVRDRVLFLIVGFGAVVLLASRILSPIALGEAQRITIDLGVSALGLLGLVIVALIGTNLVYKEIEKRTIFVVLSRPMSRPAYLLGKWLGLALTMAVAAVGMGLVLVPLAWSMRGSAILVPLGQAILLVVCANALLAALAVLFSTLSTPVLSTVYTLALYGLGFWTEDLRGYARQLPDALGLLARGASYVLPNLEIFNLRANVAYAEAADPYRVVLALGYALAYAGAVLAIAVIAFERKELK